MLYNIRTNVRTNNNVKNMKKGNGSVHIKPFFYGFLCECIMFELVSKFQPTGDQPQAIDKLVQGIEKGYKEQTLLGVTGSGKTFTMANIIAKLNRPTLILAHNKTLAGQLCSEFKEFFPNNAVEYFVS